MTALNQEELSEVIKMLQNASPVLWTIEVMNRKMLKDMKFGEIHITEFVKNGRIIRIQVTPSYSEQIPELDKPL